jgi:hypothetical protein
MPNLLPLLIFDLCHSFAIWILSFDIDLPFGLCASYFVIDLAFGLCHSFVIWILSFVIDLASACPPSR